MRVWNGTDSVTKYVGHEDTSTRENNIIIEVSGKYKEKIIVTNLVTNSLETVCKCFPGGTNVPQWDTLSYVLTDTVQKMDRYSFGCLTWHTSTGVQVILDYYYLEGRVHLDYYARILEYNPIHGFDEIILNGIKIK